MTKEEILMKYLNVDPSRTNEILLRECIHRAMDEYGRQCFDVSKEMDESCELYFDRLDKYQKYEDYLIELEK